MGVEATQAEQVAPGGLRSVAAKGFAWSGGQALFNRFLSLVGFVVLARLLAPTDYGIVALANVFAALFTVLASAGYGQALVQQASIDKEDLDTIFWISLLASVGLALVLVVAAFPLADVFDEPQLRPVLQVMSLSFVFVALGSTHQAVLQRRLAWRTIAVATIVANVVATIVGISFALAGFGVWALVVQTVLGIALQSVGVMIGSGYRPSLFASMARFLALFEFSRNYMGNNLVVFVNQRADDFLIGSVLGSAALGIYTIAYRVLVVMNEVLATSVRAVALPVFARIQDDRPRLLRGYESATRMSAAIAMPAFLFMLGAAAEVVHVAFGQKWDASVPVMQILCLFGVQWSVAQFNTSLLSSIGRIKFVFRLGLASSVLQVIAFAIAVSYGIEWVAASFVIRAYLVAPIGFIVAARELDTTVWRTLRGVVPAAISALTMLGAVFGTKYVLGDSLPEVLRLVVLLAVAPAVYSTVLWIVGRSTFRELLTYLRDAADNRAGRALDTASV